jgi:DNA-directed RNA polymerase subunit E'/Rpb7
LLEKKGRIIQDIPNIFFHVSVDYLCFCPVVGSLIVGTVNMQGPDYIGVLLYGIFNGSVSVEALGKNFQWKNNSWFSKESGEFVETGAEIIFNISSLTIENDTLHVVGSMKESNTGLYNFKKDKNVKKSKQNKI